MKMYLYKSGGLVPKKLHEIWPVVEEWEVSKEFAALYNQERDTSSTDSTVSLVFADWIRDHPEHYTGSSKEGVELFIKWLTRRM